MMYGAGEFVALVAITSAYDPSSVCPRFIAIISRMLETTSLPRLAASWDDFSSVGIITTRMRRFSSTSIILPGQIAMLIPDRLFPFIWLIRQIRFKARQTGFQIRLDRQKSEFRNLPSFTFQVELHQIRQRQILADHAD